MGNKFRPLGNGPARSGRNGPSFIVCALFIGLCIVSVSYYNLSSQYTKLYDSMTEMVKQQKLLEAHLEMKKNEQLDEKQKEQEFQKNLQTKVKELDEAKGQNVSFRLKIDCPKMNRRPDLIFFFFSNRPNQEKSWRSGANSWPIPRQESKNWKPWKRS